MRVRVDGIITSLRRTSADKQEAQHRDSRRQVIIREDARSRITDSGNASRLPEGLRLSIVDGESCSFPETRLPEHVTVESWRRAFLLQQPFEPARLHRPRHDTEGGPRACHPDKNISILEEVTAPRLVSRRGRHHRADVLRGHRTLWLYVDTPIKRYPCEHDAILFGTKAKLSLRARTNTARVYRTGFQGLVNNLERRYRRPTANNTRWRNRERQTSTPHECAARTP